MPDDAHTDNGSFVTGFTVGLFAGAAGFFLFGTDKGRDIKARLVEEWKSAKAMLPDRGDGLTGIGSLRDVWTLFQTKLEEAVEEGRAKSESQPRKRAHGKTTKFKGV